MLYTVAEVAAARGVSPYLPLNLEPEIERQIERVLILADKPVMTRPIAAATVLDALPKACEVDAALCRRVEAYLQRYMRRSGVTRLQGELALSSGDSERTIPNAHGMSVDSAWEVSAAAYYQPGDYLLLNVGGVAYDGEATPTGTLVSMGWDKAQLDIGYRDHWLSPLADSSSLISTQAPTMPSVTLSNYEPIGRLGASYQLFVAEMAKQEGIAYQGGTTSGRPRLTGLQLGLEPASGYAISVNRLFQYGGGARGYGGVSGFFDALYRNPNLPDSTTNEEFGNQVASITSSIIFPGKTPLAIRAEYAGEDNAYAGRYRLGEVSFSLGIDLPKLWNDFDASYEISEWQNTWYTHHLYAEGLTNEGHAVGHWFGDERQFGDAVPGRSQMLRVGWRMRSGNYLQLRYRTLAMEPFSNFSYRRLQEVGVSYSSWWRTHAVGAEVFGGRDVFGDDFARLSATFDFATSGVYSTEPYAASDQQDKNTEFFVDLGASRKHAYQILAVDIPNRWTDYEIKPHLGVGARRRVSKHNDLGVRLEYDKVDGHSLLSLRALDYRYRFKHIALSGFFGFGRYDVGLPAYGYYWGAGLQVRDVLPKWDVGLDVTHHEKLGRDKMLPGDPPSTWDRTRMFFDVNGLSLYMSRHF